MSGEIVISRVASVSDTVTLDIGVETVLKAIRTGKLRGQITQIRKSFRSGACYHQWRLENGKARC